MRMDEILSFALTGADSGSSGIADPTLNAGS